MPPEITDEFKQGTGEWLNYVAAPIAQRKALPNQKHVNIRSFNNEKRSIDVNMYIMDGFVMHELNGNQLGVYSSDQVPPARILIENGESWTFGDVERQADRNNWNGITVECDTSTSNLTTTESVITVNG